MMVVSRLISYSDYVWDFSVTEYHEGLTDLRILFPLLFFLVIGFNLYTTYINRELVD